MTRSQVMIYEMLARNDWQRPIYMSATLGYSNYAGLQDYLALEGLAYRITPFKRGYGFIDSEKMFENMMNRFQFGGVNKEGVYLDETNMRMCLTHRNMFTLLAQQLLREDKKDKALQVLRKSAEVLPPTTIPYEMADTDLANIWFLAGDRKQACAIAKVVARQNKQYMEWLNSMSYETIQSYANTCAKCLRRIYQAEGILQDSNDPEAKSWQEQLVTLQNTPSGNVGFAILNQQLMQGGAEEE
jgi:hypothetical protein